MRRAAVVAIALMSVVSLTAGPQRQRGPAGPLVPGVPPTGGSLPPNQRPAPLARPSARFALLFLQYRRADADAAVDALSKWSEGDVIAEAVPSPNDDIWARAALASFLTEAGMRNGTFGLFSVYSPKYILVTGWGLDKNFEVHSFRAYSLVKDLTRAARARKDDRLLSFCSRWYAMATSYAVRYGRSSVRGLSAMADNDLGETPHVRLLMGSLSEPRIGPYVPTALRPCGSGMFMRPDGCVYDRASPVGPFPNPTQETLYLFKHALDRYPNMVEAHLRLGRVLHLINQNIEARPHLERALHDAKAQRLDYLTYMAGLFLGDLVEQEGDYESAVGYFRDSVAVSPFAHIANVGLGEAMLKAGDRAGWFEAAHMFDGEDEAHPKGLDPWFFYRFAQFWQVGTELRELREMARSTP